MAITQAELSRRIRTAREACGLTQEQVAERLGVSRPTVVQIEAGKRSVSSLELDKLAHLMGRDLHEFMAESFEATDALVALFRAQPDVLAHPAVADALRDCVALGREITNLERLVGVDRGTAATAVYPLPVPASRWEAIQQGERLASEERRRLGLGDAALPDIAELLEAQGIRTGVVNLPADISGLTLNDPKVGLFVVVNREHHVLRRRFSLAHEYAHVLADRDRFGLVSRTSERDNLIEVRANAFGASFLMPDEGVRQAVSNLGKGMPSRVYTEVFDEVESLDVEGRTAPGSQAVQLYDVVQLAHHFGVSRAAMLYRLRSLRLVSQAELDSMRQLDEGGRGKQIAAHLGLPEPNHAAIRDGFRHRILGLALEAYRREEISRGKLTELAAMLGISRDEVDSLIKDAGLDDDFLVAESGR
ncbi:MAG TPA: XRE family transcriptional regulator [Thermoanaerobaculia bacterium]|jgi:Zn-dependent peptidase ImmA (M78 family)/DNA-binding XRE family transcriptional regulator|nr:XRE family transcriptional regulator [Thermoanaerobaculia bacterium]